jgi:hypothetical protein
LLAEVPIVLAGGLDGMCRPVAVIEFVIVAALVNGNDSVAVIDAVDEGATDGGRRPIPLAVPHFQKRSPEAQRWGALHTTMSCAPPR